MRLTVYLDDGATLDIADFDADTALDMREALDTAAWHTFEIDEATVIVNRDHIVRIDVEGA